LEEAMAAGGAGLPTVVWLNGANCTGCTVSLANRISSNAPTDVADLLVNFIDLAFHPNLMGAAGDLAVQTLHQATSRDFILAVDGGIPTAFDGHTCMLWTDNGDEVTAMDAVTSLAPQAGAVLSIGSCASYGGIPGGAPNPTGVTSVSELTGLSTINIPGCPAHPDWIVWTIAQLLVGKVPSLDSYGRPAELFNRTVHSQCPYREREEVERFGVPGCLEELGCKGQSTMADCPDRQWNNGTNWCIGANAICLGCTESGFPDRFSPFYEESEEDEEGEGDGEGEGRNFEIRQAAWNGKRKVLTVEGYADGEGTVTIKNASTDVTLGYASTRERSIWSFSIRRPSPVPCRVLAEYRGTSLEADVTNAPGDCDQVTKPPRPKPRNLN
jgi:hydrogenase small subunit